MRRAVAEAVLRGALVHNRARLALCILAIALGVALGYAVSLVNGAAVNELALGVRTLSGEADLQVRGPGEGFDEALYPVLARLPEVAVASPVVEVEARLAGREEALRVVGLDVFRAAGVQPGLIASTGERLDVLRPDALFLSPAAARWLDLEAGGSLELQVGLRTVRLRVAGLLGEGGTQRFAVMDIAGAQEAFDRTGRLTRVDLRVRPGAGLSALRERLAELLPSGLAADTPAASLASSAALSRAYRVNLDVLALVALFTGGLLVYSTQSLAVVRRRAQLALLRVLGLTRSRVALLIGAEGAIVGVAGSALGVAAGFGIARLALGVAGADLGSGYFRGLEPALALEPGPLAGFFLLGVAGTVLASLVPAREAAAEPPALALKGGEPRRAYDRLRSPWPALSMLAAGGSMVLLPPVGGIPLFGYLAIVLLLVGTLGLLPRLARLALAAAPVPRAVPQRLALAQLAAAPGQLTVSLAAIVASVSLMVSMAIMVASFRDSVDRWIDRVLPADVYLRGSGVGNTVYLDADAQRLVASLPGVRAAEFLREQSLLLDPERPRVVLLARDLPAEDPGGRLPLLGPARAPVPGSSPIWVSEAVVDLYGFVPGAVVDLPLAGRLERVTVSGVWRDYGRVQGAIVIGRARYIELTGDTAASNAALWLEPGASAAAVRERIAHEVPGGERLEVAQPGEIRAVTLRVFDRTFAVTYALELVAVAIGLVGLSSSFGALVLARRREFGMLRHIGMTRRQIGAMLASEGLAVSAVGLAVGLALGWAMSLVLVHVVNRQSFHWGMDTHVPWAALGVFAGGLLLLATLTAVASGRQAMGVDAVRAVREDW